MAMGGRGAQASWERVQIGLDTLPPTLPLPDFSEGPDLTGHLKYSVTMVSPLLWCAGWAQT